MAAKGLLSKEKKNERVMIKIVSSVVMKYVREFLNYSPTLKKWGYTGFGLSVIP